MQGTKCAKIFIILNNILLRRPFCMSGFLRKLHNRWLAVLMAGMIAAVGTGCGEVPSRFMQAADAGAVSVHSSEMEVHYINVGQGDSTLIKCGSEAMLIDAGDDTQGTNIRYYLRKQNVKALKYLVLTHPDSDHIGGAPSVIENVSVGAVYVSDFDKDTKTSEKVDEALKQEGITPKYRHPDRLKNSVRPRSDFWHRAENMRMPTILQWRLR
jgi:beta-lactamase superfamily II metal-dependent hydrolase